MEIREIESLEQAQSVYPLMAQLRPHLTESEYLRLFSSAMKESNYVLLGLFEAGQCHALAGYRFLTDFVHGRHLYLDDLIVDENARSKGLGSQLLKKIREIALQNDCQGYRLCTGKDNDRGKSFYEKNNLDFRAVVYKAKFNS